MSSEWLDLIYHPVRLRIIMALSQTRLNTQQLAAQLDNVPESSLYRHLKIMRDNAIIEVTETRDVNGIQEKIYGLTAANRHNASPDDYNGLSKDEYLRIFTVFVSGMMHNFQHYLENSENPNFVDDGLGWREYSFYATDEEFTAIQQHIYQTLRRAEKENAPSPQRRRRKFNVLMFPAATDEDGE